MYAKHDKLADRVLIAWMIPIIIIFATGYISRYSVVNMPYYILHLTVIVAFLILNFFSLRLYTLMRNKHKSPQNIAFKNNKIIITSISIMILGISLILTIFYKDNFKFVKKINGITFLTCVIYQMISNFAAHYLARDIQVETQDF